MTGNKYKHRAKPFTFQGVTYPSMMDFARHFGLCTSTIAKRLAQGIADERLVMKRLHRAGE